MHTCVYVCGCFVCVYTPVCVCECECVCACECMHKLTQHDSAMRLMSDWLMDRQQQMVGWRCVLMGCGVQSVMTDGTPEMLKFSVDSLDLMDVSFTNACSVHAIVL